MSVRDIDLILNIVSAMTGEIYFTMKKEDYITNGYARDYFNSKIEELISSGEGAIIREGYKN